jgi:hypothetical protein
VGFGILCGFGPSAKVALLGASGLGSVGTLQGILGVVGSLWSLVATLFGILVGLVLLVWLFVLALLALVWAWGCGRGGRGGNGGKGAKVAGAALGAGAGLHRGRSLSGVRASAGAVRVRREGVMLDVGRAVVFNGWAAASMVLGFGLCVGSAG